MRVMGEMRERFGREMGEIEMISPMLKPLSAKAIPKMTGEMRDFK